MLLLFMHIAIMIALLGQFKKCRFLIGQLFVRSTWLDRLDLNLLLICHYLKKKMFGPLTGDLYLGELKHITLGGQNKETQSPKYGSMM